jgi:hypothetical protein
MERNDTGGRELHWSHLKRFFSESVIQLVVVPVECIMLSQLRTIITQLIGSDRTTTLTEVVKAHLIPAMNVVNQMVSLCKCLT